MGIFIFLAVIQALSLNEAFDFSCPSQSQWKLRAQSWCKPARNYTCLYYQTRKVNAYQDRCGKPRIEAKGYRFVFQPNLNRAKCSITRYQPFIFDTVGNSDCNFLKSVCNSEGQTTYENGKTISDRTCICNNYNGYTFVKKPMNQSYCKPFSEDCSCFVSIHPNNKSNCSLDVKCSVEIDSMTNRSLEYIRFNISQLLDNNRYNLDSPTHAIRTKIPAIVLIILVLCYLVALWIYILQTNIEQVVTHRLSEEEEEERKKREKVISSEMENRHFLRIMIVGKERVGKTCLLKRLLNESINKVSSTDGVQVVVRQCKIDIKDGKWIIGKDKSNDKKERLDRAFAKSKTKKTFNILETELQISKNLQDAGDNTPDDKPIDDKYAGETTDKTTEAIEFSKQETNDTINTKSIIKHKESETDIQNIVKTNDNIQRDIKRNDYKQLPDFSNDNRNGAESSKKDNFIGKQDKTRTETVEESEEIHVERKTQPLEMPSDLMSNIYSNSSKEDSKSESQYAPCGLWDFAGQREFYATHQAFLTNSCIYILVASMKEEVEKKNVSFTEFGNLGEYVDFWFDNIHCHQSEEKSATESLDPPVILVFTETDQYTEEDLEKRKQELNTQLCKQKGEQAKYRHHRKTFYLSNTGDSKKEFEDLRNTISAIAMNMENWGKPMPIRWILLEHLIEINKEKGRNYITLEDVFNLAKHPDIKITNFNELLSFLRFQCEVGNIIFFEDITHLIILNPQWLANAFRCLVSHKLDTDTADPQVYSALNELKEKGIISDLLITTLFKSKGGNQFFEQKDDLLNVMMRFDILVKIGSTHTYIMPSMIPTSSVPEVCKSIGIVEGNCQMSSWFCLEFEFLPPAFFNHLSVWLIQKYTPCKVTDVNESLALYRGICVFNFDNTGCDKLLLTMSTNVIALRVFSFNSGENKLGKLCSSVRKQLVRKIKVIIKRYKLYINYKEKYKCSGDHYNTHTQSLEELQSKDQIHCTYHKIAHESKMIYLHWTMEVSEVSKEEICYLRIVALLNVAEEVVRSVFDFEFSAKTLNQWIRSNNAFLNLNLRKHLSSFQWKKLNSGKASSRQFDLHMMLCLLKNITDTSISNKFSIFDTSQSSDLSRIWTYKTKIMNTVNGQLACNGAFEQYWDDITGAIMRLSQQHGLKCLRLKKSDLDDQREISKEETNCLRITNFILTVARDVVRKSFDLLYPPSKLDTTLTVQSNWRKIEELQQRKLITPKQVALLFTQKGEVSASLDIKTMVALMTCLTRNSSFELPEDADTTPDADLLRLLWYRTEITNLSEFTMDKFEDRWISISQAVLRLGGERYIDVCNELKTAPLHASDS